MAAGLEQAPVPARGPAAAHKPQRDLRIDLCADITEAAAASRSSRAARRASSSSRAARKAEKVAHALGGSGVEVFIHHSSVSRADRALAEEQFTNGQNTAIVCTSTMELGIDVGDLDQVIQVDAPASVASFLQRLGRTGRRANTRANCTFFCMSAASRCSSRSRCSGSPRRAGSRTLRPPRTRCTCSRTR